jgi:hypothetical protein
MVRTYPGGTYGAISESLCVAYYSKLGYVVSKPVTVDSRYDIIIDDGDCLKRVQCKTSFVKKKYPTSNLRITGKKKAYLVTDFDFLWILTYNGIYLLSVQDIPSHDGVLSEFSLSPKYNSFLIDFPIQLSPNPIKYRNKTSVPQEEMARIVSLTNLGVPLRTISTIMGMTQNTVQNITKNNSAHFQIPVTDAMRKDIIKMYEKCIPAPTIAEILGYKHGIVNKVIKEHYDALPNHRRPKLSDKDRKIVSDMRSKGANLSDIVSALEKQD